MQRVVSLEERKSAGRGGRRRWQEPAPELGFSGSFSVPELPDLLQMYALSRATGRLSIVKGPRFGEVWFERGDMVHCEVGEDRGAEAFYQLLAWKGGSYEFETAEPPLRTIAVSWEELLLEGCRRLDEGKNAAEAAALPPPDPRRNTVKEGLRRLREMEGFVGACVVDGETGTMLEVTGEGGGTNLEVAAACNSEVIRAQRQAMADLGVDDRIEDILVTLHRQYHLIRPVSARESCFLYLVLDKKRSNLAMSRLKLAEVGRDLVL